MLNVNEAIDMPQILSAARTLGTRELPLHAAYGLVEQICERCYPDIDPTSIRVVLSDQKAMAPWNRAAAWVCRSGPPYVVTVLLRWARSKEELFCALLHEINHVRQYQLATPGSLSKATAHRVYSWRQAAFEAASALWPGVFDEREFVGVQGRSTYRRLSDKTLHHFPDALRHRIQQAGYRFVPDWVAETCETDWERLSG